MGKNPAVRLDDESLLRALDRLEECLEAPLSGRAQAWAERVGWALAEADFALQQHIRAAEAHAGPFAPDDLKGPMLPTADQRVHQLGQDHQILQSTTQTLRQELQDIAQPFADGPKVNDLLKIRRRVRQLISDIQHHKEDETILLMENVNMDIGVGD
jgi:hypothetical protein